MRNTFSRYTTRIFQVWQYRDTICGNTTQRDQKKMYVPTRVSAVFAAHARNDCVVLEMHIFNLNHSSTIWHDGPSIRCIRCDDMAIWPNASCFFKFAQTRVSVFGTIRYDTAHISFPQEKRRKKKSARFFKVAKKKNVMTDKYRCN